MTDKKNISTLGVLLNDLGANREVMFDGKRYNSRHLFNLLESWHKSDAYLTSEGHIKFDAEGGVYARIEVGVVKR